MECPVCQYQWKPLTSWRLSPWSPIVCPNCQTACIREGKLQPLMITIGGIVAFKMTISYIQLSMIGAVMVLFLLISAAMWLDEKTIQLKPVKGGRGDSMPPADGSGDLKKPLE